MRQGTVKDEDSFNARSQLLIMELEQAITKWPVVKVLNLIIAARAMRRVHEGCVTEPGCGNCIRCQFDRAVDELDSIETG